MIQIDDIIVSFDVIEKNFCCDTARCLGQCCIEGDAGAPLEEDEVQILQEILPIIWDDLSKKAKKVIQKQGVSYIDEENEPVTSIVDGGECVFTYFDEKGICKCAIEKACKEGKIDFYKPISCHLYPIRLAKYNSFTAVNYHTWSVCKSACDLGNEKRLPVYQFLKEPLVRKFGKEWFEKLEIAAKEVLSSK